LKYLFLPISKMLLEILIFLFLGIIAGTFTGLFPGIHINLVGAMLVSLSIGILSSINPLYLVIFVVAMSITHTFLDFVPSVFLGCPNSDTDLSVLPGHELLRQGKGYEAIMLTAYGGLMALIILALSVPPIIFALPKIYNSIQNFLPYILMIILLIMIFSDKKKFQSLQIVFITGILGMIILNPFNLPGLELNIKEPLLPLLSGLFGASSIILSIKTKMKIPKQIISKPNPKFLKPFIATIISSPLCGFLPGLGSGQAAVIGSTMIKTDNRGFLILLGATNTLIMSFSFLSLYTIHKMRTGSAATIDQLLGNINLNVLILILLICIISGIISFFLTSILSKKFIKILEKINYTKISFVTLIIIATVVLIFSGLIGTLIFIISTLTGIYCILTGAKRTNMMACLLIPTIILLLS
jgi:putative membrane protein